MKQGVRVLTREPIDGINTSGNIETIPVDEEVVVSSVEDDGTLIVWSEAYCIEAPGVVPEQLKGMS